MDWTISLVVDIIVRTIVFRLVVDVFNMLLLPAWDE
jgi:hypothetical protein